MEFRPLKYIYQASGNKNAYTLLLLHGTGGDEHDLLSLAENFGKEVNVLSLRGNVEEQGMPRFFKRLGMGIFDEQDLAFRTEEMVAFIKDLAAREGFDVNKIIALGYSNGANIIGSTLAMNSDFFAGAIMYRPMQPFKIMPSFASNRQTPIFSSNGTQDPTVNPIATKTYTELLGQAGYQMTHHDLATGHGLTQEDVHLSVTWFQNKFQ